MIFLLIVIYRSPMFFLIPLIAVMFAETLSRSLGYGLSELGVTINGQSSSIMSVLVLGAGTDYALLLVSRYREELHHTVDKHEAMRTALASAGPAIFASAATVIAALLCLTIAKVNGTAGLGPIAAMGIACAALSMLTLLPALLTIFGRRAFWPFVPHTPETAPSAEPDLRAAPGARSSRARGARRDRHGSSSPALLVLVLLPLVLLNWVPAPAQRPPLPLADRRPARPGGLHPLRGAPPQARARRRRDARLLGAGRQPRRRSRRGASLPARSPCCSSSAPASPSSRPN